MDGSTDLEFLVANQRREYMAASTAESDLELAFRLQMEEAIAASASVSPSACTSISASATASSSATSPAAASANTSYSTASPTAADLSHALDLQSIELDTYQQELRDAELSRIEIRRVTEELRIRANDERLAREIHDMPDEKWDEYGDNIERPIELVSADEELPFQLYFKGMTASDLVSGELVQIAGIGVAVCDPKGELLLKIQKPVTGEGASHEVVEAKALIEGLNAIVELGIRNANVYFEFKPFYNHVIGKWKVKQQKVVNFIDQVQLLQRKLDKCQMFLLPRCNVRFVFKLAREVIDSQITKCENSVNAKGKNIVMENCSICLEVTDFSQMFSILGCGHRFCFSCMRQHVEVKLRQGMLPGCPHLGCCIILDVESCRTFVAARVLEIMYQRIKESSIPPNEKVYCPYPRCSALMSTSEAIPLQMYSTSKPNTRDNYGLTKCIKCGGYFCINCKVPWHGTLSCYEYKRSNPHLRTEDVRLQSLAKQKLWRQCEKCNHMIELAEGCFHMTCRCGYEFCYTCGAEWLNKKATCACPLWTEQNIWFEDPEEESDDDYYEEDPGLRYNPYRDPY
ncbi:hypothetical protein KSP40_PGU006457 [Platanthera guangdongensis]|uniref:RBR-type E3 ubiquitin transferase n=1 Tax=Platanthera guangdongensis TaxID=2320717 RepID=A0ABR2LV93_9ASPA